MPPTTPSASTASSRLEPVRATLAGGGMFRAKVAKAKVFFLRFSLRPSRDTQNSFKRCHYPLVRLQAASSSPAKLENHLPKTRRHIFKDTLKFSVFTAAG
jgi:hypothetical protein